MVNVLMVGLDYAGKTSIRQYLQTFDVNRALRTETSTSIETFRKSALNIYVVPGQELLRYEERIYEILLPITQKVCFVVDSADVSRFDKVKKYFEFIRRMMSKYASSDCELIVLAHKQDLPNAVDKRKIAELLDVDETYVLATSIMDPISMSQLCLKLIGMNIEVLIPFSRVMKEKEVKAVFFSDKEIPYILLGDVSLGVIKLKEAMDLVKKIQSNMIIIDRGAIDYYFAREDFFLGFCEVGEFDCDLVKFGRKSLETLIPMFKAYVLEQ